MPFRIDRFKIDRHELIGERLRVEGYLSRTGIQIYDQGDGTQQREQRDAAEVFDKIALKSFHAAHVTIGHPESTMVDAENWKKFSKGHIGDDVRKAEDGIHTKASIWIVDGATQREVISGKLCELSCGYYADLDETPGKNDRGEAYDVRQINIRGNHVALLEAGQARGGRGCRLRLDSAGDAIPMISNQNTDQGSAPDPIRRELMQLKIRADGYDYVVEAENDQLITALRKDRNIAAEQLSSVKSKLDGIKGQLEKAEKDLETSRAKFDVIEAEKADLQKKIDAFEMDKCKKDLQDIIDRAKAILSSMGSDDQEEEEEELDQMAEEEEELDQEEKEGRVKPPEETFKKKSDRIKVFTLKKIGVDSVDGVPIEKMSKAYIQARFDIAFENSKNDKQTEHRSRDKNDPLSKARKAALDADLSGNHNEKPLNLTQCYLDRISRKEAY